MTFLRTYISSAATVLSASSAYSGTSFIISTKISWPRGKSKERIDVKLKNYDYNRDMTWIINRWKLLIQKSTEIIKSIEEPLKVFFLFMSNTYIKSCFSLWRPFESWRSLHTQAWPALSAGDSRWTTGEGRPRCTRWTTQNWWKILEELWSWYLWQSVFWNGVKDLFRIVLIFMVTSEDSSQWCSLPQDWDQISY